MGFASLLPEEESKELMANYANIIVRSSEQLVHIIDDIVLYSRLQTKLLSFIPNPFNVQNLLTDVKQSFSLPDYQKGVELNIETDSEIPVWVRSDYEKVRQLFTNLVSNAFKYTKQGTITIGFVSKEDELEFFVKDTGMGIPPEELEKVFYRFYRGSNVNKGVIGGTGLGLSIVKELVELLGGRIWIESEIYKGSTFYFTLPVYKNQ
jgi:signal transduction histidine kinase